MKDTIVIIEGPQGVGKTTFTNYLREKMGATDLYRLSGVKDKTKEGLLKVSNRYNNLLEYIKNNENVNMIFDRTFFSEEIYGRLGYKPYFFTKTYQKLLEKLDNLDYNIYLIMLYLEDTTEYEKRIKRNKHQYQAFDVKASIEQQEEYLKLIEEVEKSTKNIKIIKFNNNTSNDFEEKVNKQFGFLFQ